jgi:hypothetical protein
MYLAEGRQWRRTADLADSRRPERVKSAIDIAVFAVGRRVPREAMLRLPTTRRGR